MSKLVGNQAEDIALNYLLNQGLKLIERNFYSRFGEIDLIMRDKESLVFVEVKFRKNGVDSALESITYAKQKKLVKAAQFYLAKLGHECVCRFDAVVFSNLEDIMWLKNII